MRKLTISLFVILVAAASLSVAFAGGKRRAPAAAPAPSADAWVLLDGDDAATMSGSTADLDTARAVRKGNEAILWFRRGGKAYVIRDASFMAGVSKLFAAQRELRQARLAGRDDADTEAEQRKVETAMNELEKQQEALEAEQEKLGAQQEKLGVQQEQLADAAEKKIGALLDAAIANKTAAPL